MHYSSDQLTAWFSLRSVLDEMITRTDYRVLDSTSQRLFEWIYLRCKQSRPLHAQEILYDSKVASHATIHKCLVSLETIGLIVIEVDPKDTRRKIITTTQRADQLVAELSAGVQTWVQSN